MLSFQHNYVLLTINDPDNLSNKNIIPAVCQIILRTWNF